MIMNYWPKLQETTKNKVIASIFGIIAIAFVLVLGSAGTAGALGQGFVNKIRSPSGDEKT